MPVSLCDLMAEPLDHDGIHPITAFRRPEGPSVVMRNLMIVCHHALAALADMHHRRRLHGCVTDRSIVLLAEAGRRVVRLARASSSKPSTPFNVSIGYRAPEDFLPGGFTNPASDVWSIGASLVAITCGENLFTGTSVKEIRESICAEALPFVSAEQAPTILTCDPWWPLWEKLLVTMLTRNPSQRPSAKQLLRLVRGMLQSL